MEMKILTIPEVAKLLQINMHTAYRYAKEGKIPAVRIGGSWRVREEILEQWLKERSGNTTGALNGKKVIAK
ncbi:MAG: helix-turn-helix domain-containing protein [Candidatus Schekmanbacteria bacterium]|nr:helix-turn-helix domain-containing protein [Candidatus Schekmanbacteria bacterium]